MVGRQQKVPSGLLWRYRGVRFATVAATCTLAQLLVLAWLTRLGVGQLAANGIGFVLSAQANFALSALLTWGDRRPGRPGAWAGRWVRFNSVALVALAVNELVFTIGGHAGLPLLMASAAGILTGAAVTFTLNNFVTFRDEKVQPERRPAFDEISGRAGQDGVAFFLPA